MPNEARFDIQLLLPEVSEEHDPCADRLSELIIANEGIEKAHVDSGEFCIHFDPNRISFDKARSLVATAGAELSSRYGHLAGRSKRFKCRNLFPIDDSTHCGTRFASCVFASRNLSDP